MSKYLVKDGAWFYFRIRVPRDLKWCHPGKAYIKYALGTANPREAKRLALFEAAKVLKRFEHDRKYPPVMLDQLPRRSISTLTRGELERIAATVCLNHLESDVAERARMTEPDEREKYDQERLRYGAELRRIRRTKDLTAHYRAAGSILGWFNISYDERDPAFQVFNTLLLDQSIKAADAVAQRVQGALISSTDVVKPGTVFTSRPTAQPSKLLDIAELALQRSGTLTSKTVLEKRGIARSLDRWLDGKDFKALTRVDCQAFVDHLSRDAAENTVRKKVGYLRHLLQEAVDMELIAENPAARVKLPPKPKKKSRIPYDFDDLKVIFASPIYVQGQRPKGGRGEAAAWMPLIGLFTGARLEEIAQLQVDDVRPDPFDLDLMVFRFMDLGENQEVKTEASRRYVPVHSELVKAGLLRFVAAQRKEKRRRLFHELTPDASGSLSGSWSKWWGRYARNTLGIKDGRKVFHSFRHLFVHVLRREGVEEEVRRALVGHANHSTHAGYGAEDFPMQPKVAAMKLLRFPGLHVPPVTPHV